jgi:N-terminal domain of reverse transcriptase
MLHKRKQIRTVLRMSTFKKWKGVNWRRVQKRVDKLQTSILKNSQTYKDAIVKVLQQRLIRPVQNYLRSERLLRITVVKTHRELTV